MDHTLDRHGAVAVVTLARPGRLNALGIDSFRGLADCFEALAGDATVRAVVVTGSGRAFCAGASLDTLLPDIGTSPDGGIDPDRMRGLFDGAVNRMMRALLEMPKPIVTAVNGLASGGGVGLALAGDVVLAAREAYFHLPFVPQLAIVPDCGASWVMSRLAGRGRALAAMLTGERIPAETAADWGLVWQVHAAAELMERTLALAGRLAEGPVDMTRDLRQAVDAALSQDLDAQLDRERDANVRLCAGPTSPKVLRLFCRRGGRTFVRRRPRTPSAMLDGLRIVEIDGLGPAPFAAMMLADLGITCSMSRSGNVWDHAAMESFFSSLKTERTARTIYRTRDGARADVFDYIERFYTPRRRHSTT